MSVSRYDIRSKSPWKSRKVPATFFLIQLLSIWSEGSKLTPKKICPLPSWSECLKFFILAESVKLSWQNRYSPKVIQYFLFFSLAGLNPQSSGFCILMSIFSLWQYLHMQSRLKTYLLMLIASAPSWNRVKSQLKQSRPQTRSLAYYLSYYLPTKLTSPSSYILCSTLLSQFCLINQMLKISCLTFSTRSGVISGESPPMTSTDSRTNESKPPMLLTSTIPPLWQLCVQMQYSNSSPRYDYLVDPDFCSSSSQQARNQRRQRATGAAAGRAGGGVQPDLEGLRLGVVLSGAASVFGGARARVEQPTSSLQESLSRPASSRQSFFCIVSVWRQYHLLLFIYNIWRQTMGSILQRFLMSFAIDSPERLPPPTAIASIIANLNKQKPNRNPDMLKLQNLLLRHSNNRLSLRLAFHHLQSLPPALGPTTLNKALYLQYVEQVLKNKQNDLMQLEAALDQRQAELMEVEYKAGMGAIVEMLEGVQLAERTLRAMQARMGVRDEEYLGLYRKYEQECRVAKGETEEALRRELAEVMAERRQLRTKLSQFAELQSYEKYLNELHQALQVKSQELAQRQSIINESQIDTKPPQMQYSTGKSQSTHKKRVKIFNTKSHAVPLGESSNTDYNSRPLFCNETFAKERNNQVNESSAIMAEDSKENIESGISEQQPQKDPEASLSGCRQQPSREHASRQKIVEQDSIEVDRNDYAVQVEGQSAQDVCTRLQKQALMLKAVRKWFKFSLSSNKATVTKKKSLAVHLWKLNMCYDERISTMASKNIEIMESIWQRKQRNLVSNKMLPYASLSLKRKIYAELMFELQQKIFHRKRIQTCLSSVLLNKNRKQRLIFYYFFCRFVKNCSPKPRKPPTDEANKTGKTHGTMTGLSDSNLCSVSSSHILHEQRINLPGKKSNSSLPDPNIKKAPPLRKQKSSQKLHATSQSTKQNQPPKKEQQLQLLKQFVTEKERTEKLLATQCVRMEGLVKMCLVLVSGTFRATNSALQCMKQELYRDRVGNLQGNLTGMQFRFELMMTKIRLGLANNSNKISTLQNLLQFSAPK